MLLFGSRGHGSQPASIVIMARMTKDGARNGFTLQRWLYRKHRGAVPEVTYGVGRTRGLDIRQMPEVTQGGVTGCGTRSR